MNAGCMLYTGDVEQFSRRKVAKVTKTAGSIWNWRNGDQDRLRITLPAGCKNMKLTRNDCAREGQRSTRRSLTARTRCPIFFKKMFCHMLA